MRSCTIGGSAWKCDTCTATPACRAMAATSAMPAAEFAS